MATTLNPNAALFFPATTTATPAAGELSLIHALLPSLPPPQHYNTTFTTKNTIFFSPSLVYYYQLPPSHLSFYPNYASNYYLPPPPPKLSEILPEERVEEQALSQGGGKNLMRRSCRKLWVPKSSSDVKLQQEVKYFSLVDDLGLFDEEKCTVMIKNIPNKISRRTIVELLDRHCYNENKKIKEENLDAIFSEFDFVYLPMDFTSGNNLGYAFVNFTTPTAAKRLYNHMNSMRWDSFGSRKICEISLAKIQGLEELVKHFRRSIFNCSSSDYLPVLFQPSRDGFRNSEEQLVGKLVES